MTVIICVRLFRNIYTQRRTNFHIQGGTELLLEWFPRRAGGGGAFMACPPPPGEKKIEANL